MWICFNTGSEDRIISSGANKYFPIAVKQNKEFLTELFQTSEFYFGCVFYFAHRKKNYVTKANTTRVKIISPTDANNQTLESVLAR